MATVTKNHDFFQIFRRRILWKFLYVIIKEILKFQKNKILNIFAQRKFRKQPSEITQFFL